MKSIAMVSRSFWPEVPAIGEALLMLSESLAKKGHEVRVIAQVRGDFHSMLSNAERGEGVNFSTIHAGTSSSSHLIWRILELLVFSLYTFGTLCRYRPSVVYVATNPPVLLPFLVNVYCILFNRKFIYHLQDIHPEATQVILKRRISLLAILRLVDCFTIRKASKIITLTEQMSIYVTNRAKLKNSNSKILLLENPTVQAGIGNDVKNKKDGFIYCGNAGRLQRIPLLLEAIELYIKTGGLLPFVFVGGGVHSSKILALSKRYEKQVTYLGVLPGSEAADVLATYKYALMPIEDEVTNYAFPSKSSSYAYSTCYTIAICGINTSVAQWIMVNRLGFVVSPEVSEVVRLFHYLSNAKLKPICIDPALLHRLMPITHAEKLEEILLEV